MRAAFDLFAGSDGAIDTEEMKTVVPLIGEDMTEEQVRCLFVMADKVPALPALDGELRFSDAGCLCAG